LDLSDRIKEKDKKERTCLQGEKYNGKI